MVCLPYPADAGTASVIVSGQNPLKGSGQSAIIMLNARPAFCRLNQVIPAKKSEIFRFDLIQTRLHECFLLFFNKMKSYLFSLRQL
jgi:hypothetical protein